ncbi:amino acid adenylation domain-containing protein [Vibrio sp. PP-XX7]
MSSRALLPKLGTLPDNLTVLDIEMLDTRCGHYDTTNPDPRKIGLTSRHLAYVIYTSGSTGKPKGVMNEHRGVVNRLGWMKEDYQFGPRDKVLQKTPFSFDVSVWEFFLTLWSGATMVMAKPEGHKDPLYLQALIEQQQVTILHFVPLMLQSFLESIHPGDCPSLRLIFCSGEALPATAVRAAYHCLPQIMLHNLYGPTEAAVDVTAWACERDLQGDRVPIGHAVANTQMYILDEWQQPVPQGVPGELYIGGVQVARGYMNRPELNAERFIPDPFSSHTDAHLYRTGDLGRWLADGNIEYMGRNDNQVKVRGFRIELGEIEAAIQACTGVYQTCVLAPESEYGKRLVAYVTGQSGQTIDIPQLKAELAAELPTHMVPELIWCWIPCHYHPTVN